MTLDKLIPIPSETLYNLEGIANALASTAILYHSNAPMFFNNIFRIDTTTSSIEIVDLFNKDLNKTADLVLKTLQLAIMADENGTIATLKSENKNLPSILGDCYNHENKSINIGGIDFSPINAFDKDEIKDLILSKHMGINLKDYNDIRKVFRAFEKTEKGSKLSPEKIDDDIKYLVAAAEVEKHNDFIQKIKERAEIFTEYRSKLSNKDKVIIDQKTQERGMVDSVIQTSSYLTPQNGIEQISSKHGKQQNLLKEIMDELKDSPNIDSIEIDQDASLEAILETVKQINELDLNAPEKMCLKVRKLGNYGRNGANGLYLPNGNIVAVDPRAGKHALWHEIAHMCDISNLPNLTPEELKQRDNFINAMTSNLDREHPMVASNADYYSNPYEVIARSSEIGFILNSYGHQEGESMDDFIERVRKAEIENDGKSGLVKPIDEYLKHSAIYFDFQNMDQSELTMLKTLANTHLSFDKSIKPSTKYYLDMSIESRGSQSNVKKGIKGQPKTISRFSESRNPFRNFEEDNISFILDANKKEQVISIEKLATTIVKNASLLSRSRVTLTLIDTRRQYNILETMGKWLKDNTNNYEKAEILKELLPLSFQYNPATTSATAIAINNCSNEDEVGEIFELVNDIRNNYYLRKEYQPEVFESIQKTLKNMLEDSDLKLDEFATHLTNTSPILLGMLDNVDLRNALTNVLPNGGSIEKTLTSQDFYEAVIAGGGKADLENLRKALVDISEGNEVDTFEIKEPIFKILKNAPDHYFRTYSAPPVIHGNKHPMKPSANRENVRLIQARIVGRGDARDFSIKPIPISGKNQHIEKEDAIYARESIRNGHSVKSILENGNGIIATMIEEIDKAIVSQGIKLERKLEEAKKLEQAMQEQIVEKPAPQKPESKYEKPVIEEEKEKAKIRDVIGILNQKAQPTAEPAPAPQDRDSQLSFKF